MTRNASSFNERQNLPSKAMLALLPTAERTPAWLQQSARIASRKPDLWAAGTRRQAQLDQQGRALRNLLAEVLRKMGAFETD